MDDLEKSRSASLNFLFLLSTFVLVVLQIKEKKKPTNIDQVKSKQLHTHHTCPSGKLLERTMWLTISVLIYMYFINCFKQL